MPLKGIEADMPQCSVLAELKCSYVQLFLCMLASLVHAIYVQFMAAYTHL